jgi:hypothetical protein
MRVCLMDLFLPCRVLEVVRRNFHAMSFSGLVPPLPGSTGFLQMRAVKSAPLRCQLTVSTKTSGDGTMVIEASSS